MMFHIRRKAIQLWAILKWIKKKNSSLAYKNSYWGKAIHMSLCEIKDSVLMKLITKRISILILHPIYFNITHYILQDVMATKDLNPVSVSFGTNAQCTTVPQNAQYLCKRYTTYTRRYGPLRGPTPSSCRGLPPSAKAFFALRAKKRGYYAVLSHFWQFLVSSSNIGNF